MTLGAKLGEAEGPLGQAEEDYYIQEGLQCLTN